ncbi:hypothetical protein VKT23_017491 [Stygiomarasmius scandens]|uniref:MULE transposase domain-containing protein n=1 Tax=Marasmiellus scandens TaxID=2682957 RepID=A0ABR1IS01_9AGAR
MPTSDIEGPATKRAPSSSSTIPHPSHQQHEDQDDEGEGQTKNVLHYDSPEGLYLALRQAARQPTFSFSGSYCLPADPLVSNKERVRMTAKEVWTATTYRLVVRDNKNLKTGYKTRYYCSQDEDWKKAPKPKTGERDHVGMKRYACNSSAMISARSAPGVEMKTLITIRFQHEKNHQPYYDVELPKQAIDIIRDNLEHCTPSSLVPVIQRDFPNVTAAQIYRAWSTMSEELWKRDPDQMTSAKMLLEELGDDVDILETVTSDGVEQLAWTMKKIMGPLRGTTVEVALDATYNTNSRHLELYSVMAEHDNAGFPISYCLLSTAESIDQQKRTKALAMWAQQLRDKYGVKPSFIHLDKDMAEIGMARDVWFDAKIQLCLWHLRRAVRERLAKPKLSTTPYNALRAHLEFNFVDIQFHPLESADAKEFEGGEDYYHPVINNNPVVTNKRPGPNSVWIHLPGSQASSASQTGTSSSSFNDQPITRMPLPTGVILNLLPPTSSQAEKKPAIHLVSSSPPDSKRTFCPQEHREKVLELMVNHLHAHMLIPGYSAPSGKGIRTWAVEQMYRYCVEHGLREVWAYLWENWYRPGRWDLWARSTVEEIPWLKTTMIMESHWRRIKEDFLHHFHKPRLDLLVWILVVKLAPSYYRRLDLLLHPVGRYRDLCSWRKGFKREWKRCEKTPITYPMNPKYRPDARRWLVEKVPPTFFLEVTRNQTTPIWTHSTLKPLDDDPTKSTTSTSSTDPDVLHLSECLEELQICDSDDDSDGLVDAGEADSVNMFTYEQRMRGHIWTIREFCDGLEYQIQFCDARMLDNLERAAARFLRLANDCLSVEKRDNTNRGHRIGTWDQA